MAIKNLQGKLIEELQDEYMVFPNGEVANIKTGKLLKPYKGKGGYLRVDLGKCKHKGRKRKNESYQPFVHRLVAEHFLPRKKGCDQINHKDGNKENNKVDNLQWCTGEYNRGYYMAMKRIENALNALKNA